MTPGERTRCIEAVASLASADPDNMTNDPRSTFLPLDSTLRALAPDVFIVLGSRGAGKTVLFRLVTDPQARQVVGDALGLSLGHTQWIRCFAAQGTDEPHVAALEDLEQYQDVDLRALWACLLVRNLAQCSAPPLELPRSLSWILTIDLNRIADWLAQARAALGEFISTLDAFERTLEKQGRTIFCCYDALDRISPFSRNMRRQHLRVLLALWSSLSSRYRAIRAKIFLREDLADPRDLEFPDASKLLARSASLDWSHEDLSRLVVRYLASHSADMRAWLLKVKGLRLREDPHFGWLPERMPAAVRIAFTTRLTGVAVGAGIFRVETGRWVTGRLEDANHRITPRTVLRLFGRAGQESLRRAGEVPRRSSRLLDESDLAAALHYVSHLRVAELCDDYPIVKRIRNLAEVRIPISRDEAIQNLARPSPGEEYLTHVDADGAAILEELKRLGVASVHTEPGTGEVVDIPDIYRFGFGIKADYATAIQSYMMHGVGALRWLQRGEESEMEAEFAKQLDDLTTVNMLKKAQQLCISGSVSQAIALLENVVNVALHRNSPGLHVSALSQMAEVVLTLDAKLSLKLIEQAKAVLEQHPYLPSVGLKRLLDIRRCLAYLWIGDLERARAAFDALDRVSSDNPLYGDELWIDAQLALRERPPHEAATVGRGLIEWARGNEYLLHEWRGFLVVAAAVLLAGTGPPQSITEGLLPWTIDPDGIDERRLRVAAGLSLAPLGASDASSVERQQGELFATRLISALHDKTSLEDMLKAAATGRERLLDEAAALVQPS